ncbi:MAG: exosortase E/protease, VPEID-CTERM system [Planctomycetota bacterium]
MLPACIAVGTAVLLFGGDGLRRDLAALERPAGAARTAGLGAAHVLAFAAFFALTGVVLDPERGGVGPLVAWAVAGGAAYACLLAAVAPLRDLGRLGLRSGGVLGGGTLLGLCAWQAGRFADAELWGALGQTTLLCVHALLHGFSNDVVLDAPAQLVGLGEFRVRVGSGCSGWEGIGLISVFLGGYLWAFRETLRFPRALVLLPLGAAVMWGANVVRIAALIGLGAHVSPELAVTAFHARAGWILFCAISLALVLVAKRWSFVARSTAAPAGPGPATPWLLPLLVLVGGGLLTGAFAADVDLLAPLAALAAGALAWRARARLPDLSPHWSPVAVGAGALVFALWVPLAGRSETSWEELRALPSLLLAGWLALRCLATVLIVPIVEEVAFRGYLLRLLQSPRFDEVPLGRLTAFSVVGSSVLFGLLHQSFVAATLAGMIFALVLARRARLGDAVVAHATANGLLVAWALGTGQLGLWL